MRIFAVSDVFLILLQAYQRASLHQRSGILARVKTNVFWAGLKNSACTCGTICHKQEIYSSHTWASRLGCSLPEGARADKRRQQWLWHQPTRNEKCQAPLEKTRQQGLQGKWKTKLLGWNRASAKCKQALHVNPSILAEVLDHQKSRWNNSVGISGNSTVALQDKLEALPAHTIMCTYSIYAYQSYVKV